MYSKISRNERGASDGPNPMIFWLLGMSFGLVIGNVAHSDDTYSEKDMGKVQIQNSQIAGQLAENEGFSDVSHVVLNVGDKTVKFSAIDTSGVAETCSSDISIKDDVAKLTGTISCSHLVQQ